ncbi:MAG: ArgP/LysG family DNA-binding transcriptional regulator [Arthrobacter sp.]|jgi:LysR family transcriptional regulator (chromosome initiation inhibitor)|nr:ArgP/LysG family DNA-binding transcriptional regulator [Arthrobacter sp.]
MSDVLPLHQLAALAAVIDEGGFEAAARALHVSPPAISQRLKALEKTVGRSLIQRSVPPVPTAAGERLLPHARRLVSMARDAALAVGLGAAEGERPTLQLAVNADSLDTWFLESVSTWPGAHSSQLLLERADQEDTHTLLVTGAVQAAVTTARVPAPGCTSELLGVMRYLPVAAPRLLASAPEGGLARLPMVDYDDADDLQRASLASWVGRPVSSLHPPRHKVPSSTAFARAVEAGLGWGMLPEEQALPALRRGTLVPLPHGAHHDVVLFWHRWEPASVALTELSAHLLGFASARLRRPDSAH